MLRIASILAAGLAIALTPPARAQVAPPQGFVRPTPGEFKGTNYFPSTTLGFSNAMTLLSASGMGFDGAYVSSQIRSEIIQISKAGINNIRVFPSFYGYLVSPSNYMANLKDFAGICRSRGVTMTFVMWNTTSNRPTPLYLGVNPNGPAYDAGLHLTLQQVAADYTVFGSPAELSVVQSFGEPWQFVLHDFPNNDLFVPPYDGVMSTWPNNLGARCIEYIDAIGDFFANDPDGQAAFGAYDGFNEPDCCDPSYATMIPLMRETYGRLAVWHASNSAAPRFEFTVGFADFNDTLQNHLFLSSNGIKQTYLSYHCYETGPSFTAVAQQHRAISNLLAMPVVCSEFHDRNRRGHLGSLATKFSDLRQNGIAGNVWAYLATNLVFPDPFGGPGFVRFDGLVVPSTIPSPSFSAPVLFMASAGLGGVDAAAVRLW